MRHSANALGRKTALVSVIVGMSCLTVACKPKSGSSEAKYGHFQSVYLPTTLIAQPPGATIAICGDSPQTTMWALKSWGTPIGRSEGLKFDTSCPATAAYRVTVYSATRQEAVNFCAQQATKWGFAPAAMADGPTIYICTAPGNRQWSAEMQKALLLHECGHLWGMADNYAGGNRGDQYTQADAGSAMNSGNEASPILAISADDIAGIKALASPSGTNATVNQINAQWAKGSSGGNTWGGSSTTPTPPTTPPTTGTGGTVNYDPKYPQDARCPDGHYLGVDGYCHPRPTL